MIASPNQCNSFGGMLWPANNTTNSQIKQPKLGVLTRHPLAVVFSPHFCIMAVVALLAESSQV